MWGGQQHHCNSGSSHFFFKACFGFSRCRCISFAKAKYSSKDKGSSKVFHSVSVLFESHRKVDEAVQYHAWCAYSKQYGGIQMEQKLEFKMWDVLIMFSEKAPILLPLILLIRAESFSFSNLSLSMRLLTSFPSSYISFTLDSSNT